MPKDSNRISRFWQELKRRNVIRVITVYAGAAFVIIELINNITGPLRLPEWTPTLVIILLAIGFPVLVIFSWIYDVHPEGGMVKTKPVDTVKAGQTPQTSNGWKIASYISFVVIVGLIILNVIPRSKRLKEMKILEKSIAVLPFINDSPDDENTYFINGVMEEILLNLQAIKDFQVPGRTSVEQYRNQSKPIPVIARELNVNYIIEGSGQKYGNSIRLRIQLLEGDKGMHVWGESYEREIQNPDDLFDIQSEIAQSIAAELKAVITPAEKELIEKVPTTSLMANELYQRGREDYIRFLLDVDDRDALNSAQEYYLKALEYDPTYAKACAGVALTLYSRLSVRGEIMVIYSDGYLEDHAFDSVYIWANKALDIDRQLPEAYYIRGAYYWETGNREKAEKDCQTAIQLNPSYWEAYLGLGNMYTGTDYIKVLQYYQKAASLVRGPELSYILTVIIQTYMLTGMVEQERSITEEYVDLTQDSLIYYVANGIFNENPVDQHYWLSRAYAYDSTNPLVLSYFAESCITIGDFEEGLKYYKESLDIYNALHRISHNRLHRIGYAFELAGYPEEADYYFDRAEEICKSLIRLNRPWAQPGNSEFDLALIYAFKGEKSRAMEILKDLQHRSPTPYIAGWYMQWDPMLDGIRDDPEFQQIANDLGLKWAAECERVRRWLEVNDML